MACYLPDEMATGLCLWGLPWPRRLV